MARNNVRLVEAGPAGAVHTIPFKTDAGSADIKQGEVVVAGSSPYAELGADGEATTTNLILGIAGTDSTHTADNDGKVTVMVPEGGMRWQAAAKSATAVDSQAKVDALINKRVPFDLTTGVFTVDTAAVDAADNGLVIVGGDFEAGTIDFVIKPTTTLFG